MMVLTRWINKVGSHMKTNSYSIEVKYQMLIDGLKLFNLNIDKTTLMTVISILFVNDLP